MSNHNPNDLAQCLTDLKVETANLEAHVGNQLRKVIHQILEEKLTAVTKHKDYKIGSKYTATQYQRHQALIEEAKALEVLIKALPFQDARILAKNASNNALYSSPKTKNMIKTIVAKVEITNLLSGIINSDKSNQDKLKAYKTFFNKPATHKILSQHANTAILHTLHRIAKTIKIYVAKITGLGYKGLSEHAMKTKGSPEFWRSRLNLLKDKVDKASDAGLRPLLPRK